MEMENQMFVKQMFAGPSLTAGHRRTLVKEAFEVPPCHILVHIIINMVI